MTGFERAVLEATLRIPYGEVRPYTWVAQEMGRLDAVRAVGNVLARNPLAPFVPCHRVVRADGRLGTYSAGGRDAKRALLAHEGLDAARQEELARRGVRLVGSGASRIFCYPSCSRAREIGRSEEIRFRRADDAVAAGHRPCPACRPAGGSL